MSHTSSASGDAARHPCADLLCRMADCRVATRDAQARQRNWSDAAPVPVDAAHGSRR